MNHIFIYVIDQESSGASYFQNISIAPINIDIHYSNKQEEYRVGQFFKFYAISFKTLRLDIDYAQKNGHCRKHHQISSCTMKAFAILKCPLARVT